MLLKGLDYYYNEKETDKVFIYVHGFKSDGEGGKAKMMKEFAEKNNAASISFSFRGCGKSEMDLKDMTFDTQAEDLKNIIDYVIEDGKTNITLFPASMGGSIVTLFLKKNPDYKKFINEIIYLAPCFDIYSAFKINENEYLNPIREFGEVSTLNYGRNKEETITANLIENVKQYDLVSEIIKQDIKATIVHGTEDDVVPFLWSKEITSKNNTIELLEVKDGHRLKDGFKEFIEKKGTL